MRLSCLFIFTCMLGGCGDSEGTTSVGGSSTDPGTTGPAATSASTNDPGITSDDTTDSGIGSGSASGSGSTSDSGSASSGSSDDTAGSVELEGSVYSLVAVGLDGGDLLEINPATRRDAFLMRFDPTRGVLQTAACLEESADTPLTSPCLLSPDTTYWACECYGYAIEGDELALAEFEPGDTPPMAELGVGLPEADLDPAPSGFALTPLPADVWGSDGSSSIYVLEQRADTLFDKVLDDPDGRPVCAPC